MLPAEFAALIEAAHMLRQQHPQTPVRELFDKLMLSPAAAALREDPVLRQRVDWLGPRSAWAELLREAFAPEVEGDYLQLLEDPDPEVRTTLAELWHRTVVKRFGRRYLAWDA